MTIKLFQFPPIWNLPNPSPFCLKLETYLRMTNTPYEIKQVSDPRKAPAGKLPFITDNGKEIPDSGMIIDYLKETYGDILDRHLTAEQKAIARSFQRLIDEHLYWAIIHTRWSEDSGWNIIKPSFFGQLPFPIKLFIPNMLRKKMLRDLYGQGLGHQTSEATYQLAKDDIKSIADFLGEKDFMFGDQATSIDACVYGSIPQVMETPFENELKTYTLQFDNLKKHSARMKAIYFAD